MKSYQLLRAIFLDVLIDNFDVVKYEKSYTCFDMWLDEKKVELREDKRNVAIVSYGFGDCHASEFPPAWPCHMASCAQTQVA